MEVLKRSEYLNSDLTQRLMYLKSKLGKRNSTILEALSTLQLNMAFHELTSELAVHLQNHPIVLFSLGDSLTALYSLSEGAFLGNTLLANLNRSFHQTSRALLEYSGANIISLNVGFIPGHENLSSNFIHLQLMSLTVILIDLDFLA